MTAFRSLPGSALAVGAFVLTVLLGLGGASASALWLQTATATKTVTATGNWPGPPITQLSCTNDNPEKIATLRFTVSAPATISYAALQPNGSYGTSYLSVVPGIIVLTTNPPASQVVKDNPASGPLTLRLTATYLDQNAASVELTLSYNASNGKLVCPPNLVPAKG